MKKEIKQQPVRLNNPLLKAVWSMRVGKKIDLEIIPDIILQEFNGAYKTVEKLALSSAPTELFLHNKRLCYVPLMALNNGNKSILIGHNILSLSYNRPCQKKNLFFPDIMELCEVIKKSNLIENIEMISLKYTNCVTQKILDDQALLDLNLTKCGKSFTNDPIYFSTDIIGENDVNHYVLIIAPVRTSSSVPGKTIIGNFYEIKSSRDFISINGSWDDIEANLNLIHDESKKVFLDLLEGDTIESLGPVYD
jgi:uncharacterized protein (TIGR04255 family)